MVDVAYQGNKLPFRNALQLSLVSYYWAVYLVPRAVEKIVLSPAGLPFLKSYPRTFKLIFPPGVHTMDKSMLHHNLSLKWPSITTVTLSNVTSTVDLKFLLLLKNLATIHVHIGQAYNHWNDNGIILPLDLLKKHPSITRFSWHQPSQIRKFPELKLPSTIQCLSITACLSNCKIDLEDARQNLTKLHYANNIYATPSKNNLEHIYTLTNLTNLVLCNLYRHTPDIPLVLAPLVKLERLSIDRFFRTDNWDNRSTDSLHHTFLLKELVHLRNLRILKIKHINYMGADLVPVIKRLPELARLSLRCTSESMSSMLEHLSQQPYGIDFPSTLTKLHLTNNTSTTTLTTQSQILDFNLNLSQLTNLTNLTLSQRLCVDRFYVPYVPDDESSESTNHQYLFEELPHLCGLKTLKIKNINFQGDQLAAIKFFDMGNFDSISTFDTYTTLSV
eukprot:gene2275-2578_t